jgi:hypothetical protein
MSLTDEEKRMVGASDIPALLGVFPWSGPVALWARIVHGWEWGGTSETRAATAAEDYNRALYRDATGYTLAGPAKWRHPFYAWLRCSPDDTATDTPEGRRIVELKRYNNLDGWGAAGTDKVPIEIWVQVQFQAGVGLDVGEVDASAVDVSGLLRGEHRLYSVPHVPEVYERCVAVAERFWRDFVIPQRCPEGESLVLLERDAEALRAIFPAPKTKAPLTWDALTESQRDTVRRWLQANDARTAWERHEMALKIHMQHLLREAPGLALPEGMSASRVDFRPQAGRSSLDIDGLRSALADEDPMVKQRVEALLRQFTKQTTTRPLVAR